jgi:hypothetical protein
MLQNVRQCSNGALYRRIRCSGIQYHEVVESSRQKLHRHQGQGRVSESEVFLLQNVQPRLRLQPWGVWRMQQAMHNVVWCNAVPVLRWSRPLLVAAPGLRI